MWQFNTTLETVFKNLRATNKLITISTKHLQFKAGYGGGKWAMAHPTFSQQQSSLVEYYSHYTLTVRVAIQLHVQI